MNKEIKEKWIKALRSGEYKQGKNVLRRRDNTFCCLGVLCDLYIKETGKLQWKDSDHEYLFQIDENTCFLPLDVRKWSDLTQKRATLMEMNDELDKSFNEIADYIEKEL